jgi:hypothetical protein
VDEGVGCERTMKQHHDYKQTAGRHADQQTQTNMEEMKEEESKSKGKKIRRRRSIKQVKIRIKKGWIQSQRRSSKQVSGSLHTYPDQSSPPRQGGEGTQEYSKRK